MRLRYKLGLVLITLSMAVCFMLYQSYALWIVSLHGTENTISVGCFDIVYEEFGETNPTIQLKNTYPMSDSKGLEQTPYKFKVKNNCSILSRYVVTLNTLTTNHIKAGLNEKANQEFDAFDLKDKIKFALVEESNATPEKGKNLGEYAKVVSNLNTDLENLSVNNLAESIILATGVLGEEEERTYSLYLWYDESAGNEIMGHSFEASVNIINRATSSTENQESIFPETVIDELDEAGNGLITQTHEDYEGKEEGWKIDELRFVGPDPHNYIEFNGEQDKWRIIGLVNVKTTNGTYDQRIKIIRESIGELEWDTNNKNDWSKSSLKDLLNQGSYFTRNEPYTENGLTSDAKNMIDTNIIWALGGTSATYEDYIGGGSGGNSSNWYKHEREGNVYEGNSTEWKTEGDIIASVGLMYPSDYGYATGGGEEKRNQCLLENGIGIYDLDDCQNNDWLFEEDTDQWTLSLNSYNENLLFYVCGGGFLTATESSSIYTGVRPVVYLKPSVTISGGKGIIGNNFKIS